MDNKTDVIFGIRLDAGTYASVVRHITYWIEHGIKSYICVATVYLIMECQSDHVLRRGVNNAGLVVTDGMPLVWFLQKRGKEAQRVYGPTLMLKLCELARIHKWRIYLLGGARGQSQVLIEWLRRRFPGITIVGHRDTPLRPIPPRENNHIIGEMNASRADIVFVGMGCPYQERWMIEERKRLRAHILIGVGAAFDFFTGRQKQSPAWVQSIGFEWLFRLVQEPRRLWRRYIIINAKFCILVLHHYFTMLWSTYNR